MYSTVACIRYVHRIALACLLVCLFAQPAQCDEPTSDTPAVLDREGGGSYCVVTEAAVNADADWRRAVDALVAKHDASVIVFDAEVESSLALLRKLKPRYVCLVLRPELIGRDTVVAVHRMSRTIDDDPYADFQWGIITGRSAEVAERVATYSKPLRIWRTVGDNTDLRFFKEGVSFHNPETRAMTTKAPGRPPVKGTCESDPLLHMAELLNEWAPDYFETAGHANVSVWQYGQSRLSAHGGVTCPLLRNPPGRIDSAIRRRPMARKRYGPEQIIRKLREAEVELAKGATIPAVCKKLGVTQNTYYRWRKEYGGLRVDQAKRLKELVQENARLKKLVADKELDIAILKEAAEGNF